MSRFVKPEAGMDDETVRKHFESRHMPVGTMDTLVGTAEHEGETLLRAYHKHIHALGYEDGREVNHEHREAQPE